LFLSENFTRGFKYFVCISVEEEPAAKVPRLMPFSGIGRRLDGKPSTQSVEQASTPVPKQQQTEHKTDSSNRTSGKLVFGSNANAPKVQPQPKVSFIYRL